MFARNIKRIVAAADKDIDITIYSDPKKLLSALHDEQYEVVLSDIFMPQMTGLEFIECVRKQNLDLPNDLRSGSGPFL